MLIKEIDVIGPQTLQASVRHTLDVFGPAIRPAAALARLEIDVKAELCGDHNLVADRLERLAHQFFVRERSIGFGRIEMGDAKVISRTNQPDHLALVGSRSVTELMLMQPRPRAETSSPEFPSFLLCIISSPLVV